MTKTILLALVSLILMVMIIVSFNQQPNSYSPVMYYDRSGIVKPITKIYRDTFTVNTASGYSVDLTPAGFSSVKTWNVIALKNSATATSVPNASVKSITTTALVVNLTEGNGSLINVLGNNVLLGPSTAFAATAGLLIAVEVKGN